jgi:hypothetical protein
VLTKLSRFLVEIKVHYAARLLEMH